MVMLVKLSYEIFHILVYVLDHTNILAKQAEKCRKIIMESR